METTREHIKPEVFVNSITFNDGKTIEFNKSDIVVFTGANNSGKSQVLRDIYHKIEKGPDCQVIVIKGFVGDFLGTIDEIVYGAKQNEDGNYYIGNGYHHLDNIRFNWSNKKLYDISPMFVNFLNTERRLISSNSPNSFDTINELPNHPIQTLYLDDNKENIISSYFRQAFDFDLIVDKGGGSKIPVFVGEAPNLLPGEDRVSMSYRERLTKLSLLENEGDGMRSFASVLLDTFTSNHTITLIDEPEAFLHPPQARLLGKMLAKNTPNSRQLFISTHSEDFLKGLLDAENTNVKIIRINREEKINHMNLLDNKQIKDVWADSILRYSNIMSGLFHSKVVLCESDADCRFYQAVVDALFDNEDEISPDVLFTHCGGKQRFKTVINALLSLNVKIAIIADIDVLNDKNTFKIITDALEIDWDLELNSDWTIIDNYVKSQRPQLDTDDVKKEIQEILSNTTDDFFPKDNVERIKKVLKNSTAWSKIKETGKTYFTGDSYNSFNKVEKKCREKGLFIVPVGELECFYKPNSSHGPKWVNEVLESVDLANNPEINAAREFIRAVISY